MPAIRVATASDAGAVAGLYCASRAAGLPQVTWAHDAATVREWVANILIPAGNVYVATDGAGLLGFVGLEEGWVEQLYVDPLHWRRRCGSALLDFARSRNPAGMQLWCFQANLRARAFYERHGLVAVEFTDGQRNEEREPDMRYVWTPTGSPIR